MSDIERNVIREPAMFDKRSHPCGCVTVFDTEAWTSRTLAQCDEHHNLAPQPIPRLINRRPHPCP